MQKFILLSFFYIISTAISFATPPNVCLESTSGLLGNNDDLKEIIAQDRSCLKRVTYRLDYMNLEDLDIIDFKNLINTCDCIVQNNKSDKPMMKDDVNISQVFDYKHSNELKQIDGYMAILKKMQTLSIINDEPYGCDEELKKQLENNSECHDAFESENKIAFDFTYDTLHINPQARNSYVTDKNNSELLKIIKKAIEDKNNEIQGQSLSDYAEDKEVARYIDVFLPAINDKNFLVGAEKFLTANKLELLDESNDANIAQNNNLQTEYLMKLIKASVGSTMKKSCGQVKKKIDVICAFKKSEQTQDNNMLYNAGVCSVVQGMLKGGYSKCLNKANETKKRCSKLWNKLSSHSNQIASSDENTKDSSKSAFDIEDDFLTSLFNIQKAKPILSVEQEKAFRDKIISHVGKSSTRRGRKVNKTLIKHTDEMKEVISKTNESKSSKKEHSISPEESEAPLYSSPISSGVVDSSIFRDNSAAKATGTSTNYNPSSAVSSTDSNFYTPMTGISNQNMQVPYNQNKNAVKDNTPKSVNQKENDQKDYDSLSKKEDKLSQMLRDIQKREDKLNQQETNNLRQELEKTRSDLASMKKNIKSKNIQDSNGNTISEKESSASSIAPNAQLPTFTTSRSSSSGNKDLANNKESQQANQRQSSNSSIQPASQRSSQATGQESSSRGPSSRSRSNRGISLTENYDIPKDVKIISVDDFNSPNFESLEPVLYVQKDGKLAVYQLVNPNAKNKKDRYKLVKLLDEKNTKKLKQKNIVKVKKKEKLIIKKDLPQKRRKIMTHEDLINIIDNVKN